MSKYRNLALTTALVALAASPVLADKLGLGRAALPEEIAAWDLDVSPDGTGLPEGSGDVFTGEEVFADNCAICHGDFAEGVDNWPKLAGGADTLADKDPLKTVGSYWPHLSTAWDYVNRSMPFGAAQTLSADEVYAIVAYILYSNDLVDDDFELTHENFASFEMPNAGGFIVDDREQSESHFWTDTPCMSDCKDSVEITMRAAVLDVTPEEETEEAKTTAPAEPAEVKTAAAPAAAAPAPAGPDPELVAAGESVFKKQCKSCHQVGEGAKNRTGPVLNGIVGRPMGMADGFKYSKGFKTAAEEGRIWDDEAMHSFLTNPKDMFPKTRMSFRGLKKPEEIDAILAYLRTQGG